MINRKVSHYRIISKLGEGGMGVVYKAEDAKLERTVALKFLNPDSLRGETDRARFLREARAAATLDHSSICHVYDFDEVDGQTFLAMSYLEGESLKSKIASGPLSRNELLLIAIQVAEGLQEAHRHGIIHRDVKPSNILFAGTGHAKITDFGLARTADATKITKTGTTVGTVTYMSPEQTRGREVDHRTDIWSLGVVLYEMATGLPPFRGDFDHAVAYAILHNEPESVTSARPELPGELGWIIHKALAKDPGDRYPDMTAMLHDLRTLRGKLDAGKRLGLPSWVLENRARLLFIGFALLVVAAMVGLAFFGPFGRENAEPVLQLGQPIEVTGDIGWEGAPALSPDGSRIAYASDATGNFDIFVIDARGGNPLQLTGDPATDTNPDWFPDGSDLVFASDRTGDVGIWKVNQMGGNPTLLLPQADHPAISPDGTRVAFSRALPSGVYRIFVAPLADPAQARQLTRTGAGTWNHSHPAWSPDSRLVCYATQHNLWVIPAAGGQARQLTTGGEFDTEPVWSSDGRYIYFSSGRDNTIALWRVSAAGNKPQRLTVGSGPERHPSVSRNGGRLAYTTHAEDEDVVIVHRASGEATRLPGLYDDFQAAISRDGSHIAFISDRWGNKSDIWLQQLSDGKPVGTATRLTDQPGNAAHPAFSPDGRWLAYYRIVEGQRDIWVAAVPSGRSWQFTEHPAQDIHPSWAADGSHLAFSSNREGTSTIWIAPITEGRRTGEPRRIISDDLLAAAPEWSPDGSQIAFIGNHGGQKDVWLAAVNPVGPARQLTSVGDIHWIRWNWNSGAIWVSGEWDDKQLSLRAISPSEGGLQDIDPPFIFGAPVEWALFDMDEEGHLVVISHSKLEGNIWVLKAAEGVF
jgi:Tol biopolymer transport system component/predicted Ser/Thr protein kinase